jgi:hypothetical protein
MILSFYFIYGILLLMSKGKLKKMSNQSLAKSQESNHGHGLSFANLMLRLHQLFGTFPDRRRGSNQSKRFNDAAMGAFSLFYTQSPSFLSYQKLMRDNEGMDNARSMFGIHEFLSDNHIRNLLDEVPPQRIFPFFLQLYADLKQLGYMDSFRSYSNNLLLGLDGTQYFSSKKICCESCCQRRVVSGKSPKVTISYHHSAVMAAFVHPGHSQVISLPPEFIIQQDGSDKQDCELNAAVRWLGQYGESIASDGVTLLGDDLYCHHDFCRQLLSYGFDFILSCKPASHITLYEYVKLLGDEIVSHEHRYWTGRRWLVDKTRYLNDVPLREGQDAQAVNWFDHCTVVEETGEVIYHNSWATNFKLSADNIVQLVIDARSRWKIENENNNVLKTRGYHLEHNFGHGEKNLSGVFLTFNILAFLIHTIQELVDAKYQRLYKAIGNRKTFFNDIKTLTRYMYFPSWEHLIVFMLKGLKLPIPSDTS